MKGLPHSLLWVRILLSLLGHGKSAQVAGRRTASWGQPMTLIPDIAKARHCGAAPMLASPALPAYIILQTRLDYFWDLQEPVCLHPLGHARQRCQVGLALTWRSQQFLLLVRCGCAIAPLSSRSSSIETGRVQQVDKWQEERTQPWGSCFAWVATKQEFCILVTGRKETLKKNRNKKSHA